VSIATCEVPHEEFRYVPAHQALALREYHEVPTEPDRRTLLYADLLLGICDKTPANHAHSRGRCQITLAVFSSDSGANLRIRRVPDQPQRGAIDQSADNTAADDEAEDSRRVRPAMLVVTTTALLSLRQPFSAQLIRAASYLLEQAQSTPAKAFGRAHHLTSPSSCRE